jgi:DnaJ like chaperone protein
MGWGGKILGGTLGMLAAGPMGAALGAFIGHQFDTNAGGLGGFLGAASPNPARVNELFFPTTFRVMGHIAKADGRVSEQEIASARAVMQALRLTPEQVRTAIGYFYEGKQPEFDLDQSLGQLRTALAPYPDLSRYFLEIQLQAALAGNGLAELPRARLRRAAQLLGLNAADFARLESILRWSEQSASAAAADSDARVQRAYAVIEARADMSDEEVVKAYRRQMSRHHPDKLRANGLPDSMLEHAKERTQQIQAAYELIRERRGMR